MMEAAQHDKMDLHCFLGLDLPAPMPHHSLLINGNALLGDCSCPVFLDDSPINSYDSPSLCGSGSSAFPYDGELGEDLVLPYENRACSLPFLEQSQVR